MTTGDTQPQLSVVMPVHNGGDHLGAAIESILVQSEPDFEFVILDDASTDDTLVQLRSWAAKDSRIRIVEGKINLGPAESSNAVVSHSRGTIVARMDADDLSEPERLEKQLRLLNEDPDVGMVGSLCLHIDADGNLLREPEYWRLRQPSCFSPCPHGSIMYRRALFDRVGGYRRECEFWEDQDFILRMASAMRCMILPEPLYKHRQSEISTRLQSDDRRVERAIDRMYRSLERLQNGQSYDDILKDFDSLGDGRVDPRVFISVGSLRLWAGELPKLFQSLLRRGSLGADRRSLAALAWTGWAALSPATLRRFLAFMFRFRNRKAHKALDSAPVAWRPSCAPPSFSRPAVTMKGSR